MLRATTDRRRMIRALLPALLLSLALADANAAHRAAAPQRSATAHEAVPLPRPRPPLPISASGCFAGLVPALAVAEPQAPITGPGACGAGDLVLLKAIRLVDGHLVALHPPAQLRCPLAELLTTWVRRDVAPAVEMSGGQLAGISVATSYECRTRNNVAGAKLSEHATGDAVDVEEVSISKGKRLALTDTSVNKDLRTELMQSACRRFTTVLGPGSDAFHEGHVHLDVLQRRGGYRICQWEVR